MELSLILIIKIASELTFVSTTVLFPALLGCPSAIWRLYCLPSMVVIMSHGNSVPYALHASFFMYLLINKRMSTCSVKGTWFPRVANKQCRTHLFKLPPSYFSLCQIVSTRMWRIHRCAVNDRFWPPSLPTSNPYLVNRSSSIWLWTI